MIWKLALGLAMLALPGCMANWGPGGMPNPEGAALYSEEQQNIYTQQMANYRALEVSNAYFDAHLFRNQYTSPTPGY